MIIFRKVIGIIILIISISGTISAQPGQGGNPGGGPGGGQGDPCSGRNPPPWCTQPAPIEGIYLLVIGAAILGFYFSYKKRKREVKSEY